MCTNIYEELRDLDKNLEVIYSFEPFRCPVCFANYGSGEGLVIRDCFHIICLKCIEIHVKQSTDAEIKCPYVDAEYKCECFLQVNENLTINHMAKKKFF
jgi:RanBP-type and C3HC4-type zinc finger-containing protein 1